MRFNLIYYEQENSNDDFSKFIEEDIYNSALDKKQSDNIENKLSDLVFLLEQHPLFYFKNNQENLIDISTKELKENTLDILFEANQDSKELAHYNYENGHIYLSTSLLANKKVLGAFQNDLRETLSENELINYAFLHELGHAIQHQLLLENSHLVNNPNSNEEKIVQFLAEKFNYNNTNNSQENNLIIKISNTISEGYADLYACTVLKEVFPKDRFNEVLNQIIESRTTLDSNYNTHSSLIQFKEDIKNNTYNPKDFNELNNYIEKTTKQEAVKTLMNNLKLENFSSFEIKKVLPVLGHIKNLALNNSIDLPQISINSSPSDIIKSIGGHTDKFNKSLNDYKVNKLSLEKFNNKDYSEDTLNNHINELFGSSFQSNSIPPINKQKIIRKNNLTL